MNPALVQIRSQDASYNPPQFSSFTAEPELDYSVDTVNLEFPTGSGVGHTQCANISISSDGLVEADESFTVHATIDSPISIRFVTNLQQSDSVNVIIRDDDGEHTQM